MKHFKHNKIIAIINTSISIIYIFVCVLLFFYSSTTTLPSFVTPRIYIPPGRERWEMIFSENFLSFRTSDAFCVNNQNNQQNNRGITWIDLIFN